MSLPRWVPCLRHLGSGWLASLARDAEVRILTNFMSRYLGVNRLASANEVLTRLNVKRVRKSEMRFGISGEPLLKA